MSLRAPLLWPYFSYCAMGWFDHTYHQGALWAEMVMCVIEVRHGLIQPHTSMRCTIGSHAACVIEVMPWVVSAACLVEVHNGLIRSHALLRWIVNRYGCMCHQCALWIVWPCASSKYAIGRFSLVHCPKVLWVESVARVAQKCFGLSFYCPYLWDVVTIFLAHRCVFSILVWNSIGFGS